MPFDFLQGGCQCGEIRYCITQPPLTFYTCHCTDCQKQSSSAFGMSLWTNSEAFEILNGQPEIFETTGESGALKRCAFCKQCGSRIYHCSGDSAAYLSVKAGSVDDLKGLRPIAHIWVRSAMPWAILETDQLPKFVTDTEDQVLLELWQNSLQNIAN